MSGPYRSVMPCPGCNRELRVDAGRLHCDGCQGAMLSYADLRQALGIPDTGRLVWVDGKEGRRKCPHCGGMMKVTCLRVSATRVVSDVTLDRCEQDGVWFDRGELSRLLAAPRS